MNVTMRFYQGPEDMELQYDFWRKVTRDLPWAWKPTRSPLIFHEQPAFDPRSRCFVFDGEELVGHMGFSGSDEFISPGISMGARWVSRGYSR
ncbi:hypothetical protein LC065_13430 [Halobacillus litoralis]|uniref:hypothetical protein n=1 Tax=Halobacillus litoralis TaxID=45668 RepID=UPI00273D93AA|nr:hypothetical protein [Halobacillus litoralis]WLR46569.1 hypothetical protein LC065_13430 [Halobacillus litoralis]